MVLSRRFFATRGVLLVMKTLENERYVVIKAYKCTVSEIWRDSFVLAYIACTSYPYIQSLPTLRYYISPSCKYASFDFRKTALYKLSNTVAACKVYIYRLS